MNIAPKSIHAPASVQSVRPVRLRGRQAFVRALVLGCAMACASMTAFAGQDRERERDGRSLQQQAQQPQQAQPSRDVAPPRAERAAPPPPPPPPQRVDPRQGDAHAYDEQRRQAQQQDQSSRRGGRLTPDERAELRRQINEAGVELYPNAPRR